MPEREKLCDCLGIALVALVPLLLLRPLQNTPFIDDWTYAWSVERLLGRGELRLLEWSAHLDVVHVLWGALFCAPAGFSFAALRASTFVLAVLGLCGLYLTLRELEVPRPAALLGAATLGVNPIFFMLAFTFMTDVPFLAISILAGYAAVRALRTERDLWLVAAAVLSALAMGVRVVGVVMPIALAMALLRHGGSYGRRPGRLFLALAPLAFLLALLVWARAHTEVSADISEVFSAPANRWRMLRFAIPLLPRMLVVDLEFSAGVLGAALLPLSFACARKDLAARAAMFLFGLGLVLAADRAFTLECAPPFSSGSTWALEELGATRPLISGFVRPAHPAWLDAAAIGVTFASFSFFLAMLFRRRFARGEALLAWSAFGQFLLAAVLWLTHDRYALVLMPPAIALLLASGAAPRKRVAIPLLLLLGTVSLVGVRDHLAYSRALWQAVGELKRLGAREAEIDGGYVVNGWLQYAHPENAPRGANGRIEVPWLNSARKLRFEISNQPAPDAKLLKTIPYDRWLGQGGALYLVER